METDTEARMSSKYAYEEFIHLGKQSYRDKRYDVALGHYQNALRIAKQVDLDILDALAATSEKTGEIDAALRYGKQMLQFDAKSARVSCKHSCLKFHVLILLGISTYRPYLAVETRG
jgi:tetratricopeptide (TPR) repeat protein